MRKKYLFIFSIVACSMASSVQSVDYWRSHDDPGMVSNNDCGVVSRVEGEVVVRRAFVAPDQPGTAAYPADRLHTGDELVSSPDATLEWQCGNNLIVVLGPDSRVRLLGLRLFTDMDGKAAMRLDVALVKGEVRAQARLNTTRPESVLLVLPDADVLLRRGDVAADLVDGWGISAIGGQIEARIKREGVPGAAFAMAEGSVLARGGEDKLEGELLVSLKRRLPFTFERISAALPPVPAVAGLLEAP